MSDQTWQHEELRPEIERYCWTEGVNFGNAWETLHTPLNDLTDEQIALVTHLMGWTVRDLGLQDAVTVRLEKASEL